MLFSLPIGALSLNHTQLSDTSRSFITPSELTSFLNGDTQTSPLPQRSKISVLLEMTFRIRSPFQRWLGALVTMTPAPMPLPEVPMGVWQLKKWTIPGTRANAYQKKSPSVTKNPTFKVVGEFGVFTENKENEFPTIHFLNRIFSRPPLSSRAAATCQIPRSNLPLSSDF